MSETTGGFEAAPPWQRLRLTSFLPREHGSWALVLEPLALALIVAPSGRGAALAAAGVVLFLMRRPWQLWRATSQSRREPFIGVIVAALGVIALSLGGLACGRSLQALVVPISAAALSGALFAWLDARGEGRALAAELSGVVFFAAVAMAVAVLADPGGGRLTARAVAGFAVVRGVTSIMPLRTALRRRKGQKVSRAPALVAAVLAVAAGVFALAPLGSWVPLACTVVFFARTVWLLGPWAPRWPARRLGILEAVLGVAAVVAMGTTLL